MSSKPEQQREQDAHWQEVANQLADILEDESIPDAIRSQLAEALGDVLGSLNTSLADHARAFFAAACAEAQGGTQDEERSLRHRVR